jgi:agmatine/peptidylarginine deiminase
MCVRIFWANCVVVFIVIYDRNRNNNNNNNTTDYDTIYRIELYKLWWNKKGIHQDETHIHTHTVYR